MPKNNKKSPNLSRGRLEGCYSLMWLFILKNHVFPVGFYKILAVTTSEVAGVQVVKLERTSHICYFSIDFVREKLKKYKYMANEKKSRLIKKKYARIFVQSFQIDIPRSIRGLYIINIIHIKNSLIGIIKMLLPKFFPIFQSSYSSLYHFEKSTNIYL